MDRLNRLEARVGSVQELLGGTIAENVVMRERLHYVPMPTLPQESSVTKKKNTAEKRKIHPSLMITETLAIISPCYG